GSFTLLGFLKFRGVELIDRAARHVRGNVARRSAEPLVQIADDAGAAAARLELPQIEQHAEADEQREHKERTDREPLQRAEHEPKKIAHRCSPPAYPVGSVYWMAPLRTSSIATRSSLCGPTGWRSMRGSAPRRNCLARCAATSTKRNRLVMGGAGVPFASC